jgi:hypothetical protein
MSGLRHLFAQPEPKSKPAPFTARQIILVAPASYV